MRSAFRLIFNGSEYRCGVAGKFLYDLDIVSTVLALLAVTCTVFVLFIQPGRGGATLPATLNF